MHMKPKGEKKKKKQIELLWLVLRLLEWIYHLDIDSTGIYFQRRFRVPINIWRTVCSHFTYQVLLFPNLTHSPDFDWLFQSFEEKENQICSDQLMAKKNFYLMNNDECQAHVLFINIWWFKLMRKHMRIYYMNQANKRLV